LHELAVRTDLRPERLQLDATSWVDVTRGWLEGADAVLVDLIRDVPWRQGRRPMYDRMVDDPRLSCWYSADERLPHCVLTECRTAVARQYRVSFRTTGLNYYRDGRDSVAFHRDRELRQLDDTLVAILTLGSRRPFRIRPGTSGPSRDLAPGGGDLIVMGGRCQQDWYHAVPKVSSCGPRVSVTWRWAAPASDQRVG
jgi:alkylated DNA repair dioxygenase AlkB